MRLSLATAFLLVQTVGAPDAPDAHQEDDLATLRGLWERSGVTQDGKTVRLLKDVKDTSETITILDENGRVLRAHSVDFQLKREGEIRVFLYTNYHVTEGPDRGQRVAGSWGYVYRVRGEELLEVHGLLAIDDGEPGVIVWKRPKSRRST